MDSRIIVVGAGPAGVTIAYLLATRGVPVALIEKETQFDRVFRGEGLMPSGLEALSEMGLEDCLESIPTRQLNAWDFYVDGQRRMRVVEPGSPQGHPPTRIIQQSALLQAIVERTKACDSFQFYPGWRVQDLIRQDDR
ncbi:MAG: FAD-dependent oxidoreductase, partial [Cyanobacteria bacterium P01_H01_bin.153]